MTASQHLLTMLKAQHEGCSLYALHHILGVSAQNIYKINEGNQEFSPDTVMICCDVLAVDPQPWLLRIEITRCRSPKRRQIMERMLSAMDSPGCRAVAGLWLVCSVVIPAVFGA